METTEEFIPEFKTTYRQEGSVFIQRDRDLHTGDIHETLIKVQDLPAGVIIENAIKCDPLPPPRPPLTAATPKGAVVVRTGGEIAGLVPTTMQEAWLFCSKLAAGFNLPKAMYEPPKLPEGFPSDLVPNIMEVATARAMHALQLGMEVGLPPAQAIQSIAVTNGVGTIWGDAQLGIVQRSGKLEVFKEYTEGGDIWLDRNADGSGKTPNLNYVAVCEVKRRGDDEIVFGRFSVQDAIDANLWGKGGTWKTHKPRMMKMKARAFGLRDKFADVLKGLTHSIEEMEGEVIDQATTRREPATDIAPAKGAEKLAGLLASKGVNSTATTIQKDGNEQWNNRNQCRVV